MPSTPGKRSAENALKALALLDSLSFGRPEEDREDVAAARALLYKVIERHGYEVSHAAYLDHQKYTLIKAAPKVDA